MNLQQLKTNFNRIMAEASYFQHCDWKNSNFYSDWLAQSYYFVTHSLRLLGHTISHSEKSSDLFIRRSANHMLEEFGHEVMAKNDLERMGFSLDSFTELCATKMFYRSQYYGIEKVNSRYLLGYILFLEGIAVIHGKKAYEQVSEAFPKSAVFLKVHAEEDVDHLDKAFKEISVLNEKDILAINESLEMAAIGYKAIISEIQARCQRVSAQTLREKPSALLS